MYGNNNGMLALTQFSVTFYLVVPKRLFYSAYTLSSDITSRPPPPPPPFISTNKTPYEVI